MAVGGAAEDSTSTGQLVGASAFAESWDGMEWTLLPTSVAGSAPELDAVSCVSASFCVAVGATGQTPATSRAVVELWNGTTWTAWQTPAASIARTGLSGVSCTSTSFCVAVGGHRSVVLTEIWDGARWRSQNAPAVGKHGSSLASVSCVSIDWCQAVGSYNVPIDGFATPGQPLAEHWNGRRWILQHPPGGDTPGNRESLGYTPTRLTGVSCSSRSFCVAAGYLPHDIQGSGSPFPFPLRWTGVRWMTAISGLPKFSELEGVSCVSATDCFAAGGFFTGGDLGASTHEPLVEHWSGGRWVRVSYAGPGELSRPTPIRGVCPPFPVS